MNDIDTLRVFDLPPCLTAPGEHITAARPSCLQKHGNRLRLQRMLIDDVALFGILLVSRVSADTYQIYSRKYTFDAALAFIDGRMDAATPKPSKAKARKAQPRPKAKKKPIPVSKNQMALPLMEAA